MEKTEIKFKHKKTLQHIVALLLGLVFLVVGFIGYGWSKNMLYFYLVAIGNILIIWMLLSSRVRKNQVIYDAVFIRFKLNDNSVERIKADDILETKKIDHTLIIHLRDKENREINLENYTKKSIDIFHDLLQQYA